MAQMVECGWEVEGIEASPRAADVARSQGFLVQTSTLENAVPEAIPYDLIVAWMAIEHLHEPRIALQKLHGWIKPGGWLVFSVPNANSVEFRLFKDAWYALQLPTHLFHYTPRTLQRLLQASGWTIRQIFHQRVLSNLAASAGYVLQDRRIFPRLARFLVQFPDEPGRQHQYAYPLALGLSAIGQTGRMTVWAQRTIDVPRD
jgi:2-polyprenyl-3-methyl-5-hydroxy-6-metoxy-1,4-benzoquinol methylase